MKRKRYPLWKILLTVGASWAFCALVSIIGWFIVMGWAHSSIDEWMPSGGCLEWWGGADDPAAIEIGAHLKLPPSTENLFAHSIRSWQDCDVYASFDMFALHLDSFLASTNVSETKQVPGTELSNFSRPLLNGIDWSFNGKKTYLYGSGTGEGGQALQEIVIERISSDMYKVYVVNHLV